MNSNRKKIKLPLMNNNLGNSDSIDDDWVADLRIEDPVGDSNNRDTIESS